MRIYGRSRIGKPAYISLQQSRNNPDRMFISSPNMIELSPEETDELINGLKLVAGRIWSNATF
ncbi:hypothetical protein SAMN05660282_01481 [Corynebacterium spheniscorum]|uniref:Uncharacterized protein n=1 Tax=Corynebacterium spheniscorum TaxID=185761 RepID=A0A1I2TFJ3_9CORY|nr:hypothetical protein SAMN05660282_01481 [Corynebacterium spheniscorum]